jgi:hypothetical protein
MSDVEPKVFDRTWRLSCEVKQVNRRKVDEMIQTHYIGRWPTNLTLVLGLYKGPKVLGVCTWSEPHKEMLNRFGLNTWELSRLWLFDEIPRNAETFVIGRSIRLIRRDHPNLKTLISFADPAEGHQGTIYKASNWTQEMHPSKNLFSYNLHK